MKRRITCLFMEYIASNILWLCNCPFQINTRIWFQRKITRRFFYFSSQLHIFIHTWTRPDPRYLFDLLDTDMVRAERFLDILIDMKNIYFLIFKIYFDKIMFIKNDQQYFLKQTYDDCDVLTRESFWVNFISM